MTVSWGVVVPVKRLELAKTRLASYGGSARQELALAFASDVVRAAREVARVLVVTDDVRAAEVLAELGAEVAPDDPDAGLNPALVHGAKRLRATDPDLGVATLSADLPALRSADLRAVLDQVAPGARGFVADVAGTGTTLLAAGPGAELAPAFGPASRAAHAASGAVELRAAAGVRHDVDTADDLRTVLVLGVGASTRAVTAALVRNPLQATVRSWDPELGGAAFRDDGTSVTLPPDCLQHSAFRFLRVGQRVALVFDGPTVSGIELP